MIFKFKLEKGSKKHFCPKCNKKRFVRFINSETNDYLDPKYGRCDRESACGYFLKPNDNKPLVQTINYTPAKTIKIGTINQPILEGSLKKFDSNKIFQFLCKYFDEKSVQNVFKKYNVGTSNKWNGSTVFWQVDTKNKIRTGKIMLYNSTSGKRVKLPYNHISWVHTTLNLKDYNLKQCLFGLHLVNAETKNIGIVESEKTALILALAIPNCLWLATGSKQNLKEELLLPIKNYNINVYPDEGEFNDWSKKCDELTKNGFNINCSDLMEKSELKNGSDFADLIIEWKDKKKAKEDKKVISLPKQKLAQFNKKNSKIRKLVSKFNLTDEAGNEFENLPNVS